MERQPRLLLVEDEQLLRELVAQFLRGAGMQVVQAADGREGVERFLDSGPFDLLLLDLNLPVWSGVEVARRVRRARPDQPVLICSAAILPAHQDELVALGIDHFLTKPFHPETLLAHIRAELEPAAGRRAGRRRVGSASRGGAVAALDAGER